MSIEVWENFFKISVIVSSSYNCSGRPFHYFMSARLFGYDVGNRSVFQTLLYLANRYSAAVFSFCGSLILFFQILVVAVPRPSLSKRAGFVLLNEGATFQLTLARAALHPKNCLPKIVQLPILIVRILPD